jgi:hypothetical protein
MNRDKVCVLIVNPNKISENIIRDMIKEEYRIVLVAKKIEYFTENFFDIWERFEDVYDINPHEDKWEDRLESFISRYKNDTIVNLTPLYNDKFEQNSKILNVLRNANINSMIFINQFYSKKKDKNSIENNIYKQYLYEILVSNYFKKYNILRVGDVSDHHELLKNINLLINKGLKVTYPQIYRYKMLNDVCPIYSNVNIVYDNTILRKDDMVLRTNMTSINNLHSGIFKLVLGGLFFKVFSRLIFVCIKKFK